MIRHLFAWYHWVLVAVPVLAVCALAVRCRRYVRSVSDFLVAGRCAGRYVLISGGMMGNLAVTILIASAEVHYNNGFAFEFWNALLTPLGIMLALYGWITYRFRETRAMSAGQFFEMRYSRGLRRLAAVLRGSADMLGNCIGPAVAVRFSSTSSAFRTSSRSSESSSGRSRSFLRDASRWRS